MLNCLSNKHIFQANKGLLKKQLLTTKGMIEKKEADVWETSGKMTQWLDTGHRQDVYSNLEQRVTNTSKTCSSISTHVCGFHRFQHFLPLYTEEGKKSPQQDILHYKYLTSEDIITGSIPNGYGFPEYTPGMAGSSCNSGFVFNTCILLRAKGKTKTKPTINQRQERYYRNISHPLASSQSKPNCGCDSPIGSFN